MGLDAVAVGFGDGRIQARRMKDADDDDGEEGDAPEEADQYRGVVGE
jgi:hypothetical protein